MVEDESLINILVWVSIHHITISLTHWGRQKMDAISQTTFSSAFFNDNVWIPVKISLEFVPKGPINNILALV